MRGVGLARMHALPGTDYLGLLSLIVSNADQGMATARWEGRQGGPPESSNGKDRAVKDQEGEQEGQIDHRSEEKASRSCVIAISRQLPAEIEKGKVEKESGKEIRFARHMQERRSQGDRNQQEQGE